MNVPFLVKQYLSNDLEQGSFSKIFWYYPLKKELAERGGIGMFFEVLYGDVDYEVYEQISKRFWDTFSDNYYVSDFEQALRKSIQAFTQLLRGFGVEEGLDVNIVLFNAIKESDNYLLKIITFGESDMYVIREHKVADISKLAPQNKTLKDVKFLEVDLEEGDVLLLSNKTLLQNAFQSDIIAMDSIENILQSLEEFKENLFANKKLFMVAALSEKMKNQEEKKAPEINPGAGFLGNIQSIFGKAVNSVRSLMDRNKKPAAEKLQETEVDELDKAFASLPKEEKKPVISQPERKAISPAMEKVEEADGIDAAAEELLHKMDNSEPVYKPVSHLQVAPPPMAGDTPEIVMHKEEVIEKVETIKNEEVDPVLPQQKQSFMGNFDLEEPVEEVPVVEEKVSPYKPVSSIGMNSYAKNQPVDYAAEFRNMRSPMRKLTKQPIIEKIVETLQGTLSAVLALVSKPFGGKLPGGKLFVGKSAIKPKQMWPLAIVGVLLFVAIVFFVSSKISQANAEKKALDQYNEAVGPLEKFYNDNIVSVISQDPTHQLEKCFIEVEAVSSSINGIKDIFQDEKNKTKKDEYVNKVAEIKKNCTEKYDRIYGITRIKSGTLVTDFKVSLGNDSNPVDMAIKQTSLVIVDNGRKAIYQVNPANSSIMKLEDPSSLVSDPVSVGTGDEFVFVCDKNSGVIYTDTNNGFARIVGLEPAAIGPCATVKGFGKNAYVVPESGDRIMRSLYTNNTFALPTRYIEGLADVRDLVIDGNIYVISGGGESTDISKYFAGRKDAFSLQDSIEILNARSAYTNPSDSYDIYVYDKEKNQVIAIEKATARRHPGVGVQTRTIIFDNKEIFSDIKDIVVNVRDGREVSMYVLSGSTIWQVPIPTVATE